MEPKVNAVSLTILSMIVVFIVLWGLSLMISAIKWLAMEKKEEEPEAKADIAADTENVGLTPKTVAAITAALAAYLDQDTDQLMVSAIYRLVPSDNWAVAGRLENTSASSLIRRSI